jgi:hypothetical protein
MQNTLIQRIGLALVALIVALSMSIAIAPSSAEAGQYKVLVCKKLDKPSYTIKCNKRYPYSVRNYRSAWVNWYNSQHVYFRCTANVKPPPGYHWHYKCLMAAAH